LFDSGNSIGYRFFYLERTKSLALKHFRI